jgi:hypothetical protein
LSERVSASGQDGISLIGIVIALLLLSLLGAAMVSIVTTERFVGVNQVRAASAQYLAEAGLDRALRYFFDDNESCVTDVALFDAKLGDGRYLVSTQLYNPGALTLDANITETDTSFIVDGDADALATDYAPYGIVIIGQENLECARVESGGASTFSGCKRGIGGTQPGILHRDVDRHDRGRAGGRRAAGRLDRLLAV